MSSKTRTRDIERRERKLKQEEEGKEHFAMYNGKEQQRSDGKKNTRLA